MKILVLPSPFHSTFVTFDEYLGFLSFADNDIELVKVIAIKRLVQVMTCAEPQDRVSAAGVLEQLERIIKVILPFINATHYFAIML